jgi:hypothetical protein
MNLNRFSIPTYVTNDVPNAEKGDQTHPPNECLDYINTLTATMAGFSAGAAAKVVATTTAENAFAVVK